MPTRETPARILWQDELGVWIDQWDDERWSVSGSSPRVYLDELDIDGQLSSAPLPIPRPITKVEFLGWMSYYVNGMERCFNPDTGAPTDNGHPMHQFFIDCFTERFDPALSREDLVALLVQDLTQALNDLTVIREVVQRQEPITARRRRRASCLMGYHYTQITDRCHGCDHSPERAEFRGRDLCSLPIGESY